MNVSSLGGNYLKAQMLNKTAKLQCDLYKREITKKHIHSLAAIHKNMRDMQDILKDIKANSGYCKGIEEFSSLYQARNARGAEIADLETRHNKTPALSKSDTSDLNQWPTMVTKRGFGGGLAQEGSQIRDERTGQDFVSEAGCSSPANTAIRTGKVSGNGRGERSYDTKEGKGKTKTAPWPMREGNFIEPDGRNSGNTATGSESGVNERNAELPNLRKGRKVWRSPSLMQTRNSPFNGDPQGINVHNADGQLPWGKGYKAIHQPPEPRPAWPDRPLKNRDSPTRSSTGGGTALARSLTAPAKASRLKSPVKSASVSEHKLEFAGRSPAERREPAARELKKLQIHISLSKSERRRILQELICSSTVTPDRSFLERERQTLLKEKVSKFFESLLGQADTGRVSDEEDIFQDDEDLQYK